MSTIEKQGRLIDHKNQAIECLEQNVHTLRCRVSELEAELEYMREQVLVINQGAVRL